LEVRGWRLEVGGWTAEFVVLPSSIGRQDN